MQSLLVTILLWAFSGKEASKIVVSRCSLESAMLHNFQVNFFQHYWHSWFQGDPNQVYETFSSADDLKIANEIWQISTLLMSSLELYCFHQFNQLNVFELANWRQFFMRLSCYWSWISSEHCQSSCGSADYFDTVMTKFTVNNRTDAGKTDVHLSFTITER